MSVRENDRMPTLVECLILRTRRTLLARDPLTALEELQKLRAGLDAYERELVRLTLASGASYGAVARALGITRQAAHRRYRDAFAGRNGTS